MDAAKANAAKAAQKGAAMASEMAGKIAESDAVKAAKAQVDKAKAAAVAKTTEAMAKLGVTPDDLKTLDRIPLVVGGLGLLTLIVLLSTQFQVSWAKGTALYMGEPVAVTVSLGSVKFGLEGNLTQYLDLYNCPPPGDSCPISVLAGDCVDSPDDKYPLSGGYMTTPESVWCQLQAAGTSTQAFAGIGDVIAIIAPLATLLFAAKEIPGVMKVFDKIEAVGFVPFYQKIAVFASWAALWGFLLFAMLSYAYAIPDSLGVGTLSFEFSFGMLRLCFLMVSVLTAMVGVHFAQAYSAENTAEAWTEFVDTPCCSAKKALYLLLLFQLVLYLLLSIYQIRWEGLLIFFCFYYVDAKKENFKLLYIVLTFVTLLLDVIEILKVPAVSLMSKGEAFSWSVFVTIFFSKFLVLGAMYLYSKEEASTDYGVLDEEAGGESSDKPYVPKMEDEIAE